MRSDIDNESKSENDAKMVPLMVAGAKKVEQRAAFLHRPI